MPKPQHRLEKRASLLADGLVHRLEIARNAVAPKGERPPFSVQMTRGEALMFWRQHFFDPVGLRLREAMTPDAQLELALALSRENERQAMEGDSQI